MKVESFYCEHASSLIGGKSARKTAIEHAIKTLNENFKIGYVYKCNYDAFIEVKTGCLRKAIRFIMGKKKENIITIKFKYGIFEKSSTIETAPFEFIEVNPVVAEHVIGTFADKSIQNPYLETGKKAVQEFLDKTQLIKPYCDMEIMVKIKPGCIKKVVNIIMGNSHKNKFSFEYFEFNIAQKFIQ